MAPEGLHYGEAGRYTFHLTLDQIIPDLGKLSGERMRAGPVKRGGRRVGKREEKDTTRSGTCVMPGSQNLHPFLLHAFHRLTYWYLSFPHTEQLCAINLQPSVLTHLKGKYRDVPRARELRVWEFEKRDCFRSSPSLELCLSSLWSARSGSSPGAPAGDHHPYPHQALTNLSSKNGEPSRGQGLRDTGCWLSQTQSGCTQGHWEPMGQIALARLTESLGAALAVWKLPGSGRREAAAPALPAIGNWK